MAHVLTGQPFPHIRHTLQARCQTKKFSITQQAGALITCGMCLFASRTISPSKSLGGRPPWTRSTFAGFGNVVNASYPDEWLYLYWKMGLHVGPYSSSLVSPGASIGRIYQDMSSGRNRSLSPLLANSVCVTASPQDQLIRPVGSRPSVRLPANSRLMRSDWFHLLNTWDITSIWLCLEPHRNQCRQPIDA